MMRLSDISTGRDNNLNLIRALAATAVLVSHAYPITLGTKVLEPFEQSLNHTLGTLAVYVFFMISGFLIAMSYERTASVPRFIAARVLRLMPALLVSLLLVAYVIGPLVTTLPLRAYFASPELWDFMARNAMLIKPQFTLPGVFETLPFPAIAGSIWTLFYEAACYFGVLCIGVLGLLKHRPQLTTLLVVYCLGWAVKDAMDLQTVFILDQLYILSVPFALGMLVYLWQDRIRLGLVPAAALIAATAVLRQSVLYELLLVVTLTYCTFWLAYVPRGLLRAYNRIGDYSYGIYLYAFPIQGLAVWLFGPMSPLMNMAIALPMTLIPAVLSWHLIEKPALDLRKRPVLKCRTAK